MARTPRLPLEQRVRLWDDTWRRYVLPLLVPRPQESTPAEEEGDDPAA
jgi:hypothetical protein